jgi:exodeoxyribonuclease VII small subunit
MTAPIGYGDAMAELEQILAEIERDDVDVDLLSARVTRAAELIRICKQRIHATKLEVEEIVAALDPEAAPAAGIATVNERNTE